MTTLFPIELKCPLCGTDFTSQEIGSCGFASKRTDFRPNYWGFNPTEYFFHLCPNCGFCAAKDYFNKELTNQDFKQKVTTIGPLQVSRLSEKLAQAAKCQEAMRDCGIETLNDFNLANTWILAYWWSENSKDEEKYGNITLTYFQKALQAKTVLAEDIPSITYLMGEIHRRLGHPTEAGTYFDRALALAGTKKKLDFIAKMATQQKENPQENL